MGDRPWPDSGNKTVLEAANTPNMDRLAKEGMVGQAQTIPEGMDPGSDVANMSLMGYDPAKYHTGRSPIEAASMGVDLAPDEVAFRCNLVKLLLKGNDTVMGDYCSGHIDTETAGALVRDLQARLGDENITFHPGVSYRHLLVWKNGPLKAHTVPPHDRSDQSVADVLSTEGDLAAITELTRRSWAVLENHPLNKQRLDNGQVPANSIWLWGQGTKPSFPTYRDQFGLSGVAVSAVDLVKGLGVLAGLEAVEVPGATGWLDTNYEGKVAATLGGLAKGDIAYLHIEAPDEAGHSGNFATKLESIELFDKNVVGPVMEGLKKLGDHRVLLACDHYTPVEVKTHTTEPVPYVIWDSRRTGKGAEGYTEKLVAAACGGEAIPAHELIKVLLER